MRDSGAIEAELRKPLNRAAVKPAQRFGPKGDYIEGWHAIAEANRIFGWDGWSYTILDRILVSERPRELGRAENRKQGWGVSYIARVRVTVGDVVREDEGAGHGYDVDCGIAHESAVKEAVTDALKRVLRTFGNPFGLALYDKSRENVADVVDDVPTKPSLSSRAAVSGPRQPTPLELFIRHMDRAISHQELAETWSSHRDLQRTPEAIAAKERNKVRLAAPPEPHHVGAEFGLQPVDPHAPPSSDCPF